MPPRPPRTHRVALALAAVIVAGCWAGSDAGPGCDSGGDGPSWPIVDGKAVIPSGTQSVPVSAFSQCVNLTSVLIPTSVTSIGDNAFEKTSLASVLIPTSVASIGTQAFAYCTSLASVKIPSSVTRIGDSAFLRCTGLISVEIPTNLITIGDSVFSGTGLVSVEIPASVASIGPRAFSHTTGLVSVKIPSSATGIYETAFFNSGCSQYIFVKGATVCNCTASPTWPCSPQQLPACTDPDLDRCTTYSGRGLGMCCNLEAHACVCVAQGTADEIDDLCVGLGNGGVDCDYCRASPLCN